MDEKPCLDQKQFIKYYTDFEFSEHFITSIESSLPTRAALQNLLSFQIFLFNLSSI